MPLTAAATKVRDPEYSNWLKVTLALYYLSVGLHSFVQGEVDDMHQFLLNKLYSGSGVPKPQCSCCKSCYIKQISGVWRFEIPCPSHLCDIWLAELLALHTKPKSNIIYWDNCDVTAWPFVPWECAKLYMSKGQLPANTGPDKCDPLPLLTLMAYCKCFQLSSKERTLTHKVSKIRNTLFHSVEMTLSDDASRIYLEDIIHLLEDTARLQSLEDCKQAVNEIKKIVNDSIDVFVNVELEMIALRTAVNAVRQDMGKLEQRTLDSVESLREKFIQLNEEMRKKIDTVEKRMDIVENRQDAVENQVVTVGGRQNAMENKVDTIKRDVESVKEQTSIALQSQEQTNTALQSLEKTQQQQVELSQAISASVAPLQVRVEALEEKVTNQQESGHRTEPATVSSIKPEGINKLRDDLIEAYRNLRCVQVSPIIENKRCDIDSIFVDIVIEEEQESRNMEEESKDVTQLRNAPPYSKKIIKVTSYKQVFLDEKGLKFKRVYLRGKGGYGKTTFCRKVLHAWCNAHKNKVTAHDSFFQDEAVLQTFDFLFYLNLREVSEEETLIEVICTQFPLNEISDKNALGTLLKANGDKVLFILDGLDEMIVKPKFLENIVTRRVYPNCCFLVSSRPWKIFQMELHEGTEIDLLLDLKGFSKENAIKCAKKIFEECYNDGDAIEIFLKDIEGNKLASQLIHVPLLLLILTQVWYEYKRSLPSKLHELNIMFLNLLTKRVKEKYKKDPNYRQMRFILDDMQSPLPSKIAETSLVVNFGEGLFLSLCEVAHHFLLSSQKENSLVFEETKLLNVLGDRGKEKLKIFLDLGVLSMTDSMSYICRKMNVSFLHKTVQEFFTALCFIVSQDKLANFVSSIADIDDVQQYENIIVFLVGLMPKLGNRVLEKVNELCKYNWEALKKRELMNPERSESIITHLSRIGWKLQRSDDRLLYISKIYLKCNDDMMGENVLLNVSGLVLEQNIFNPHPWNPAFLQSLNLMGTNSTDSLLVDLRGLTGLVYLKLNSLTCDLYLPESGSLSILVMMRLILSNDCCDVLGQMLTQCTRLEKLAIHETNLHNCLLDLSNMTKLTILLMFDVTLSSSCCDLLGSKLTRCTKLNELVISNVNLDNCVLVFSSMIHLHNLDLSNLTELTHLKLNIVTMSSHCYNELGSSTLSHCTKLVHLDIVNVDLQNCVLDLSNLRELRFLCMSEIKMTSSCCAEIGRTLTHCSNLRTLNLLYTDFQDCLFDFHKMTELTVLDMSNVALSSSCCDILGSTLTHCTKLERLKINNIDLHNCVLDLSSLTELTHLYMSEVTLSSKCCDVLGSTLTQCTKLTVLQLENTDLSNCMLDFNMTDLCALCLNGVTLSSSACQVLEQSLDQLKARKNHFHHYTYEKLPSDNDKWKVNFRETSLLHDTWSHSNSV